MGIRTDILLENNDIVISNHDVFMAESDDQHIVDTINSAPGWWKENFTEGVGIKTYLKAKGIQQELARSMKLNLQSDGYDARPIVTYDTNGSLKIQTNVTI